MKTLKILSVIILISGLSFLFNPLYCQEDKSTKYAIIYIAADGKESKGTAVHPIDENCTLLEGVRIYNSLREYGVKKEDIYFLYDYVNPDFADTLIAPISKEVQEEFSSDYANVTFLGNLKLIEENIQIKMNKEDTLILFFSAHGTGWGLKLGRERYLGRIDGNQKWETHIFPKTLDEIIGDNISKNNLVVINSCYSQNFIDKLSAPGIYIGSATNVVAWSDRDFGFGTLFFKALTNKENDLNKDGVVSWEEAYQVSSKQFKEKGDLKKEFIMGEYLDTLTAKFKRSSPGGKGYDPC